MSRDKCHKEHQCEKEPHCEKISCNVIHVKAQGSRIIKNCRSWKTAFDNLQDALDLAFALPLSEIWVAEGVYIPSQIYTPIGPTGGVTGGVAGATGAVTGPALINLRTFNIPDNTALFGGFKGDECKCSERNPEKHKTILSGANTYWHVVTLGNDITQTGVRVVIDGFEIIDGNAQGPDGESTLVTGLTYAHSSGAGVYSAFGSSLILSNCVIKGNRNGYSSPLTSYPTQSFIGAGVYSNNSDISICDTSFKYNYAQGQAGALAIYNTYETTGPHTGFVEKCKFIENTALNFGGAIVVEGTFPDPASKTIVQESLFVKNRAYEGGAIVPDSEELYVRCCTFIDNIGYINGGALATTNVVNTIAAALKGVTPTFFPTNIEKCIFKHNYCTADLKLHDLILGGPSAGFSFALGGTVVCYMNGFLNIDNSKFENNVSLGDGGAIVNGNAAATNLFQTGVNAFKVHTIICNSEFTGNHAVNGGAIASEPNSIALIPPVTIEVTDTVLGVFNSDFVGNVADEKGGAIFLNKTTAAIVDNCFKENCAQICNNIYQRDSIIDTSRCIAQQYCGCGDKHSCKHC